MEVTTRYYTMYANQTSTDATIPSSQTYSVQTIVQITFFCLFACLIVISNTLILFVLYKVQDCFEEMQQFVFRALAVTDLLTGIFCCTLTAFAMIFGTRRSFSSSLCAVRGAACTGLTNLSALLITCACFDRFVAIIYPLHYPTMVTLRRAKFMLVVVCSVAICNGGLSTLRGRTVARSNLCLSDFSSERLAFRPSLVTSLLILTITLSLTIFFNIKVMLVVFGQSNRVAAASSVPSGSEQKTEEGEPKMSRRRALKGLRPLIVATTSFFVAILPWNIVAASQFSSSTNIATPMARYVTSALLLCNSWMNALIFATFNRRFRAAAKRVVFPSQSDDTIAETTLYSVDSQK
ncbi:octopamine receptor beta-1R-like [Diadema setosum]|uniref:octopamine receptor beta-1R-like n=1 Tax=Diadema setosum TaxID=31175 RepID=UPI003B3A5B70